MTLSNKNPRIDISIRKILRKNELTLGTWITIGNPYIVEIMAKEGFDWLAIDMEHSAIALHEAQQLIQIIELCGVTPLVRVGENNPNLIKRVMDAGAHGIIVPMVNNREDALKAVQSIKYPPLGKRGVGLSRAQGYGLEFERYRDWINKNSIVVAQIEHTEAINNLEEILKVKDIDATIIGPYDLSASMGYPGEFERKEVKDALKRYIKVCGELNKTAGFHIIPPRAEKVKDKIREGFRFIGFSLDTLFLGEKVRKELKELSLNK